MAQACAVLTTPPASFIRQMPPSLAWTIRSSPGQAEGRKAMGAECLFKGTTGSKVEAPPDGSERYYACFAVRHPKTACRKRLLPQSIIRRPT
ncbi:hypothetical protein EMIT0P171_70232 [Pseudomonas sp. IT-P171]